MGLGLHLKRMARPRRNTFAYEQPETQKGDQQNAFQGVYVFRFN